MTKTSTTYLFDAPNADRRELELERIAQAMTQELGIEITRRHLDYANYAFQGVIKAQVVMGHPHIWIISIGSKLGTFAHFSMDTSAQVTLRVPDVTGAYLEQYHPDWKALEGVKMSEGEGADSYYKRLVDFQLHMTWEWYEQKIKQFIDDLGGVG